MERGKRRERERKKKKKAVTTDVIMGSTIMRQKMINNNKASDGGDTESRESGEKERERLSEEALDILDSESCLSIPPSCSPRPAQSS